MSESDAGKMRGLMGKGKLTTMQVVKQLSTVQIWLPDWKTEFSAEPKPYGSEHLCMGNSVNQATTRIWRRINQAATKIWGRDLHELVSSLVLSAAGEASPNLSYCLVYPAGRESEVDGRDEQDDYPCPRSTLHRESDGRSWAMNNTSNLHGVELK